MVTTLLGDMFAALGRSQSHVPPHEDQQLIDRLREGDVHAVGIAYERHHGAVRAFAQRLVGDSDVAEDLVHETFVSIPQAITRFRGASSLRTFIISVAVNHCRHHVRSAQRRRSTAERASLETAPDSASRPDHNLERRQLADALSRALDTLSMDHRVTFVLCAVEDRSSVEAAEILGISEGTVRSRLHNAKRLLRDALAKENHP